MVINYQTQATLSNPAYLFVCTTIEFNQCEKLIRSLNPESLAAVRFFNITATWI